MSRIRLEHKGVRHDEWPLISKQSRHIWQGRIILQRWCICSRDANLTESSQTTCHLGTYLTTRSIETTKWALQTRVAAGSSMIPLHRQFGSGELHLFSLMICAILNRCLHSSTSISVYLSSSESLPRKIAAVI